MVLDKCVDSEHELLPGCFKRILKVAVTSVHPLPPVAIHSVAFSGKSFFIPNSFDAFIKASLEIHPLITSPSYRFGIAMCSMVMQKQQIKNAVSRYSGAAVRGRLLHRCR